LEATRQDKKDLLHDAKKNYDKMTDAEIEKAIVESFQKEQHELDLKKKYYSEFKKTISSRKIVKLYRAERQWTLYLVQRLKELQADK
jgi:chorismate mutase